MDPLAYFFDGPRASGAFALGVEMHGPWGIEVRDDAALTLIAVRHGRITLDGVGSEHDVLSVGDVAIVRGPAPYTVLDADRPAVTVVIHPGQRCTTTDGRELEQEFRRGLRRWGNSPGDGAPDQPADVGMLIGTYQREGDIGAFGVGALPRLIVVRGSDSDPALLELLDRELGRDDLAQSAVIDRLLDLLVIHTVRSWLQNGSGAEGSWLTVDDPLVGRALRLLHDDPAEPWTVDEIATRLHVSRATLAARFRRGVGRGPIAYLTGWRMTVAGEELLVPGASVSEVARRAGYQNAFAFSTAFKRHTGESPTAYRSRWSAAHDRPLLRP